MKVNSITRPIHAPRMNSEEILAHVRQLDPRFLASVHDQYYPVVYRYVRYRLEDEHACEDIASEVFLRLLDALHHNKGPSTNLQGWLLGTASHMVNDHLRYRYNRKVDSIEDQEVASSEDTEALVDRSWRNEQIREAIRLLTADQQHVLALRFSEERSLEETAQLMGRTIGAVKTLQFRALASLKRFLGERSER